ncbi:MAG: peptidoglycan DD-metalloendopeptidase family protein [candidate division KSB1 bacterium]|nr:peptidoglycan DD-metalloendopeptidase family protein [candidate division KSB1 bacterium]
MNFKRKVIDILCAFPVLLVLMPGNSFAQENQTQELEKIRKEIEKYKEKISEQERKEAALSDLLANIDREIDLTQTLIQKLRKEENKKQQQIKRLEASLAETEKELTTLKTLYARRMVYFYKYGRIKDLEILLTARSFNQRYLWIKYQKILADNDRRNLKNILDKEAKIEKQNRLLSQELTECQKIVEEKKKEEANLKNKRIQRQQLLAGIQKDKQLYLQRLKEYEKSALEVQRLIALEEEQRLANIQTTGRKEISNFPELKGRMIWPTRGKIIATFGKHRHPQLKTITENLGIDIKAPYGQEVRCVAKGRVTAITWQRGRGNIVIVNHQGGYYTVYTHLAEIRVGLNQEVEMGQVLGTVGESGSLEGPMLHFEIWKTNQVLDPEDWLS